MTTAYLIRHGQNEFVRKKKLPGWLPGIHLDAVGEAQAERLGQLLRNARLKAVYSSPLERAVQTAEHIAAVQNLEVTPREPLGELRIGKWEGLSLKAARRRKLWAAVVATPSLVRFPGGESFVEAQARLVSELEKLRGQHLGKAAFACVSHADPIKLTVAYYLGLPLDQFQRLSVEPASISILQFDGAAPRLLRLNDIRATVAPGAG